MEDVAMKSAALPPLDAGLDAGAEWPHWTPDSASPWQLDIAGSRVVRIQETMLFEMHLWSSVVFYL